MLHAHLLLSVEQRSAKRQLSRYRKKLANRIVAIAKDREAAESANRKAEFAKLFVPSAARSPRGTTLVRAIEYTPDGSVERTMSFDPQTSPLDQIQSVFARAKRLHKGESIRSQREKEASDCISEIDFAIVEIEEAVCVDVVREAFERCLAFMPAGVRPGVVRALSERASRCSQPSAPYRIYRSGDGVRLLVGRNAHGNDQLVTKVARPHDIWLHARGYHGAHVIISLEKGKIPGSECLVDAATLAAHFSEARGLGFIEVGYAERRFVRKPKGAPAGLVSCSVEKVIGLRFEEDRLQRLLATAVSAVAD
jgi:predicted ribosome quality control (RQC) complex YloA/Tae2 family protein